MIPPRFLLDTNVLSEPIKLEPNPKLVKQLTKNIRVVATASVVYHELKVGCLFMPKSRRRQEIEDYICQSVEAILTVLPYCEAAAKWHAEERLRLRSAGQTPPYVDGQIAAIATVNNLTLVTRNVKDFQCFEELKIENWFE